MKEKKKWWEKDEILILGTSDGCLIKQYGIEYTL